MSFAHQFGLASLTSMDTSTIVKRGVFDQRLVYLSLLMLCATFGTAPVFSQPGFLSIDCGSSTNYTDTTTGIFWETDEPYISTGASVNNINVDSQQLRSLREFSDPGRIRDCYVLPTEPEQLYLVRPTFYYGNLTDAISTSASFSIYLNGTLWQSQNYQNYGQGGDVLDRYYSYEAVVYSLGMVLNFCLVRQQGLSFITSLELRRLQNGIYPDDAFDRIWSVSNGGSTIVKNSTSIATATASEAPDLPPVAVMKEAATYYPHLIYISWYLGQAVGKYFACVYCQDLDGNASATNVRGMDFNMNDQVKQSFNISSEPIEVFGTALDVTDTTLNVTLTRASWSRLPPMMNAAESYLLYDFNASQTDVDEVNALAALQQVFNLSDWNGDPCVPVPYNWVNCIVDSNDGMTYHISGLSISGRKMSGSVPNEIFGFPQLTSLSLDSSNITGVIPNFSRLGLLQYLSLRNNELSGNIQSLSSLVHLQTLHLEHNSLNGTVPNFLSSFRNLTNLHLDNNQFTGDIPSVLLNNPALNLTYGNNPGLRGKSSSSGGSSNVGAIIGGLSAGIVGLIIVGLIVWRYSTRKGRAKSRILKAIRKAHGRPGGNDGRDRKDLAGTRASGRDGNTYGSLRMFSLKEVSDATNSFSRQVGQGSFGPVYYGELPNGQEIAVKIRSGVSRQGEVEFLNELELLSRIHHGNLVALIGFCDEAEQEILVYAFLSNGSLGDHLYGERSRTPLDWKTRLTIAVDSATGLEYLHFHCNPRIIHRDIKSSNILLDKNMVAKVHDFGISKETLEGMTTGVDTLLKGTPGYIDPEYFITQRLTQKSDVYSFGIVLLELISGHRPHPTTLEDGTTRTLIEWVRKVVEEGYALDVFDPKMKTFSYQSANMVLDLALDCTNPTASLRPDMRQILRQLLQASQLENAENAQLSLQVESDEGDEKPVLSSKSQNLQHPQEEIFSESEPSTSTSYQSQDATTVGPR